MQSILNTQPIHNKNQEVLKNAHFIAKNIILKNKKIQQIKLKGAKLAQKWHLICIGGNSTDNVNSKQIWDLEKITDVCQLWKEDFKAKIQRLQENEQFLDLQTSIIYLDQGSKFDLLSKIQKQSQIASINQAKKLLIFYSGIGTEAGHWKINKKDDLKIEEIISTVIEAGFCKRLEITSDSCYSAKLCEDAKILWDQDKIRELQSIKILASATGKEREWGKYTEYKNKKISMINYAAQFGLAEFNSRQYGEKPTLKGQQVKNGKTNGIWMIPKTQYKHKDKHEEEIGLTQPLINLKNPNENSVSIQYPLPFQDNNTSSNLNSESQIEENKDDNYNI